MQILNGFESGKWSIYFAHDEHMFHFHNEYTSILPQMCQKVYLCGYGLTLKIISILIVVRAPPDKHA